MSPNLTGDSGGAQVSHEILELGGGSDFDRFNIMFNLGLVKALLESETEGGTALFAEASDLAAMSTELSPLDEAVTRASMAFAAQDPEERDIFISAADKICESNPETAEANYVLWIGTAVHAFSAPMETHRHIEGLWERRRNESFNPHSARLPAWRVLSGWLADVEPSEAQIADAVAWARGRSDLAGLGESLVLCGTIPSELQREIRIEARGIVERLGGAGAATSSSTMALNTSFRAWLPNSTLVTGSVMAKSPVCKSRAFRPAGCCG